MGAEAETKKRKLSVEQLESSKRPRQEEDESAQTTTSVVEVTSSIATPSQCFYKVSVSLYVSLAPVHLNDPVSGIKSQHLDPLLMTFFPEAGGVVLAHYNLELCGQDKRPAKSSSKPSDDLDGETDESGPIAVAKIMYDSPFAFMWINVDLLVWKPRAGDIVEGWINMQSPSHIGLLIHDTFNASIKRDAIPRDWRFVPNQEDEAEDGEDHTPNDQEQESAEDVTAATTGIEEEGVNDEKLINTSAENSGTSKASKGALVSPPRSLGYWVDGNGLRVDGKLNFTVRVFNVSGRTVSVQGSLLKPGAVKEDLTQPYRKTEDDIQVHGVPKAKHVTFVDDLEASSQSPNTGDDSN
ncbi:DNA-directed RNA polymerase I subunit RPA43 [Sugiyamaella lignohabitans]|uniref:DNA-directed RNA polymerase subunit n=1 Tax=Sugiyamaella lignohabitans TaxID=796027 RepID=A0A161HL94_9ASCO|nr:DNA-directed RNA polymerase I subunit RPA43 [Sugiyamaella lignohabitans]ANB14027.1 DNA-directed RNA polymerase I subunit RPA43 [Sugiyamaella lignohabitans]